MRYFYRNKKQLILVVILLIIKTVTAQNVGISGTPLPAAPFPAPSAGLDVNFTDKGLLIPRVQLLSTTDNTTIASPAASLLVYNLGPGSATGVTAVVTGYYYNSGTMAAPSWVRLSTGVSGWSTTGNSGTVAGTNYLGTTDDQDLVFKTGSVSSSPINNREVGRFETSTGDFNLGLSAGGVVKATQSLALKSIFGLYGNSNITIKNENGVNGAILETNGIGTQGSVSPDLTDFVFKSRTGSQSNLRLEARTSTAENLVLGSTNPEWQIGYPANPTLVISTANNTALTGGNTALRFGNFGIGTATTVVGAVTAFTSDPTASLHIIRAGTATAYTAPMKFTSGVDLGIAEAGAFEYDGLRLGFTPASAVRKRFALTNDVAPANGQIPIGNGTDFKTASILAGTGITLTPGAGTLTIAGAGGVYSAGSGIQLSGTTFSNSYSLNGLSGLTAPSQTFVNGTNVTMTSAVTTHTLGWTGQLSVPNGGTGAATFASGRLLQGNTTSAISEFPLGTANQVLGINNAANAHEYKTITAGTNISVDATTTAGVIKVSATGIGALTIFRTVITIPAANSLGQGDPITYTYSVPVVAGQASVSANSTVILNPRAPINNGVVISYVRCPATNQIVVGLTSTKNSVNFPATDFDVTVIY